MAELDGEVDLVANAVGLAVAPVVAPHLNRPDPGMVNKGLDGVGIDTVGGLDGVGLFVLCSGYFTRVNQQQCGDQERVCGE